MPASQIDMHLQILTAMNAPPKPALSMHACIRQGSAAATGGVKCPPEAGCASARTCRLYRDACVAFPGWSYVKDLSRLGRDLSSVIIVDDNTLMFQAQPCNAIWVAPYEPYSAAAAAGDDVLAQVLQLLMLLVSHAWHDVWWGGVGVIIMDASRSRLCMMRGPHDF